MLPDSFKLKNLCCGHEGKYICSLKGRFDPKLIKEKIQLGQLSCGCWIVLDGNNRIGLILKHNIEANIGDFPKEIFSFYQKDEWDEEDILFWTPFPKTFGQILPLSTQLNCLRRNQNAFKSEADYKIEASKIFSIIMNQMHECPAFSKISLTREKHISLKKNSKNLSNRAIERKLGARLR